MDFLNSGGALRAPRGRLPRTGARAPGPRRTRRGLRTLRPRPALHRRGPVPRWRGVRDSGGACVPFSRLGLHQSERCGRPTDDVRGPVPAPGRHDGRDAASASRALGKPYTAAAPSPRWRGHPRSRRRLRPFLASLGRHQSSPATAQALSAARSCRGLAHSPRGRQLVRRRPRAIRAAPPPPPQTRPVSNAYGLVLHPVRCRDL